MPQKKKLSHLKDDTFMTVAWGSDPGLLASLPLDGTITTRQMAGTSSSRSNINTFLRKLHILVLLIESIPLRKNSIDSTKYIGSSFIKIITA
jgi:hypothetical protein